MHSECLNPDVRKKLEELAATIDSLDSEQIARRFREAVTPSLQSARERLLAAMPMGLPKSIGCIELDSKLDRRTFVNAFVELHAQGEVEIVPDGDFLTYRLAPPVEGVDLAKLERAWHTCTAAQKYEEAVACRDAIAALRRRSPALPVNAELLEAARAAIPQCERCGLISVAASLQAAIARAEAASKGKPADEYDTTGCATIGVSVTPQPAASKASQSKSGEDLGNAETRPAMPSARYEQEAHKYGNCGRPSCHHCTPKPPQQPDPAARPATIGDVRELVANMCQMWGKSIADRPDKIAAIRAGDCDPKPEAK